MKTPFSKKSYHVEIGQLICKAIKLLVSIWYEFLLKGTSEQTIAQLFFKDMLIFKKQSNPDYLKISYRLTLPFTLNSFKWKALYWVECYVNCYLYFNCLLLLTSSLEYTMWKMFKYVLFFCAVFFRIQTEYGDFSYSARIRENTDQKKLHTWTLFTQ